MDRPCRKAGGSGLRHPLVTHLRYPAACPHDVNGSRGPSTQKAASTGNESYHVVLGVVWALLGYLDDRHSAQEFIGQFLSGWAGEHEFHAVEAGSNCS